MPRFKVTITQRDLAPVDAAAATKCKCKCDTGAGPISSAPDGRGASEVAPGKQADPPVELSPLSD
jgi:hypothetical protein